MKFQTLLFSLFFLPFSWAQTQTIEFNSYWDENDNRCKPCSYDRRTGEVTSAVTRQIKMRGELEFQFEIEEVVFENITLPNYLDESILPNNPSIEISFGVAAKDNFATAFYQPIVNIDGQIKMVTAIKIKVEATPNFSTQNREFEFASNSVLDKGEWYKFGVEKEGVYKLDYDDLVKLGVEVATLAPTEINVYGNQISELPHSNAEERPDDLVKNAIYIQGDSDGVFNEDDYILFYAKGPDNLEIGSSRFIPSKNKIDSLGYFFLHIDPTDYPNRIQGLNNSLLPITNEVNNTNDFKLLEENTFNLLKSGAGWYGHHFEGSQLSKNYTFLLEDRELTESITLNARYVAASRSGSSGLNIKINNVEVDDIPSANSSGGYLFATTHKSQSIFNTGGDNLEVDLEFYRSSPASEGWLDYLEFNYIRKLKIGGAPLYIRDLRSVGVSNVAEYSITNANANVQVWEYTNPYEVRKVNGDLIGSNYLFRQNADSLRKYIAFNSTHLLSPVVVGNNLGKIENQNLHGIGQADYLIVTVPALKSQADRLANLHRNKGLSVHVLEVQKIYNEFGGGMADPVAIRWMAKMMYERSATDPDNILKYLCLFGDGSYDPLNRVNGNNYLLPTYNNLQVNDLYNSNSYSSDDFFGLLDDMEEMDKNDMLDIGIGRIPVYTVESAAQVVDKIEHYMNKGSALYSAVDGVQCEADGYASTFGDWRNKVVLMADDQDENRFVIDCESSSDIMEVAHPELNIVKLYLDAHKQVSSAGGERYPTVEEAINQNMSKGALIFNYVGHGGETGLSLERVVTIPMIKNWLNVNNMTVFISATCEFSRFDDPERTSAGEITLTTPYGGAVALLTTTRLVSIGYNSDLIESLYTQMFVEEGGEALTMGEILRRTKNITLGNNHVRHFALLGDPAMKLGKSKPRVVTDQLNGVDISEGIDTLKALSKITVSGHVENNSGDFLTNYNGIVFPTVFDKWKIRKTLGQNIDSYVKEFDEQTNVIYKGKATVKNGKFTFSFVVPKDINYTFGNGKISYYTNSEKEDYYGFDTSFLVGGIDPNGLNDKVGPEIDLFMNDESFVNGGLTNTKPLFLANVRDENGINTTGNGIGHNITAIIDGNTASPIILDNFYEADLDTYQSGKLSYQFSELEPGNHQVVFKAWDVNNNSSEETLDFVVIAEEEIAISHLLNYPNPFTTRTEFFFEHNQVCNAMQVKVDVFTVSGRLVKTIQQTLHTSGFRSDAIVWDGRDEYGDRLGRGVYIYQLSIETEVGVKATAIEKLVIL